MADKKKTEKKPAPIKVKVGGVIGDGKGGKRPEGDTLPADTPKETLESLKAKGFI